MEDKTRCHDAGTGAAARALQYRLCSGACPGKRESYCFCPYLLFSATPIWMEWLGEVPGNGFTLSGPATTYYNGSDDVFVRGTNNRIYMNSFNGTTWSGWREVPGHGSTLSGPTIAVSSGFLNLFVRGTNNKIYENTLKVAGWSGWSEVPGHGLTPDAPGAIGDFDMMNLLDTVYLYVRGTNDRIYVNILRVAA